MEYSFLQDVGGFGVVGFFKEHLLPLRRKYFSLRNKLAEHVKLRAWGLSGSGL